MSVYLLPEGFYRIFDESSTANPPPEKNKVQLALESGKLAAFEPLLNRRESDWCPTFYENILRLAHPDAPPRRENERPLSETEKLCIELFIIAIDKDINDDEKVFLFAEKLALLNKKDREELVTHLAYGLPIVSVYIMHFGGKDLIKEVLKSNYKYRNDDRPEKTLFEWFKAVAETDWQPRQASQFLENIFEILPVRQYEALFIYINLKLDSVPAYKPLTHAPEKFKTRYQEFLTNLERDYEKSLKEIQECGSADRSFFQCPRGVCLVKLFKERQFDQVAFACVAAVMDEKGWKWLRKAVEPERKPERHNDPFRIKIIAPHSVEMVTKALQWLHYAAVRPEIHRPEANPKDEYNFSRYNFFQQVCKCIDENQGWMLCPDSVVASLSTKELRVYYHSFGKKFWTHYINVTLTKFPYTFLKFLKDIINAPYDERSLLPRPRQMFQELMNIISDYENKFEDLAFKALSDCSQHEPDALHVYSHFNHDQRQKFLAELFKDKSHAVEVLTQWVSLCFAKEPVIKPAVREELLKDLGPLLDVRKYPYNQLSQRPSKVAGKLRKLESLKDNKEAQEFISELSSTAYRNRFPKSEQGKAIKSVERILSLKGVTHEERTVFIQSLDYALFGDKESSDIADSIFEVWPTKLWPSIFVYLGRRIQMKNDEKSLSRAIAALIEVRGNPHLQTSDNSYLENEAIKNIYNSMKKFGKAIPLIAGVVKEAPRSNIVHTIASIESSAEGNLDEAFSQAIDAARVNRLEFLAECLLGSFEADSKLQHYHISYRYRLLAPPFIKTWGDAIVVLHSVMDKLGDRFIDFYMASDWPYQKFMIEILNTENVAGCQKYIYGWLKEIVESKEPDIDKANKALRILEAYQEKGSDPWAFMVSLTQSPDIAPLFKQTLLNVFESDGDIRLHALSLRLLKLFEPENYLKVLCNRLKAVLKMDEKSKSFHLRQLFNDLHKEGVLKAFIGLLSSEPEICESLRQYLESHFEKSVLHDDYSIVLISKLFLDWKKRLADLAFKKIQDSQDDSISYGMEEPEYRDAVSLFIHAKKAELFDEWFPALKRDTPKELLPVIEKIGQEVVGSR